jgi:hypothetical protein
MGTETHKPEKQIHQQLGYTNGKALPGDFIQMRKTYGTRAGNDFLKEGQPGEFNSRIYLWQ